MNAQNLTDAELEAELARRGKQIQKTEYCPTCRGKWPVYMGCSRSWQKERHCFGCRQPVENCRC